MTTSDETKTADVIATQAETLEDLKGNTDPKSGEVATAPSAETEPEAEPSMDIQLTWDFPLTSDSTALNSITRVIVEDDGGQLGDPDLLDRLEDFLSGNTKFATSEEKLQAGQNLLREFFSKSNRSWSGIVGTFTDYAVQMGRLLIKLKSLVKSAGRKW
jgi:hypothetical protein